MLFRSREKTYFVERLSTVRTKTELEYAIDLKTVLDIYHIKKQDIEGCIISSVVPQITNVAKLAAEKILKKEVMVVGPGLKTGLNIMLDNPGEMGADRVADAVAAMTFYPVPNSSAACSTEDRPIPWFPPFFVVRKESPQNRSSSSLHVFSIRIRRLPRLYMISIHILR